MKTFFLFFNLLSLTVFAHDEGHGPKLSDQGKQGGIVSPVVLAIEADLGTKASLLYKAELVKSSDNKTIKVYFYDKNMNMTLNASLLGKNASALISSGRGKKQVRENIELTFVKDHFEGQLPKTIRKPFDIDVKVMSESKELLTAFDNLD